MDRGADARSGGSALELFEHQSTTHPLMAFRLLEYMVRIWKGHLERHPRSTRLPAILPVVLHHSAARMLTCWRSRGLVPGRSRSFLVHERLNHRGTEGTEERKRKGE
ncbi:hypothetical protein BE11_46980 [Sorangium cellulosum]|nr:hypothetical protein BE11_46980 [Sorangium cellulosum]